MTLTLLLGGLSAGLWWYYRENPDKAEIRKLAAEKRELQEFVQRLTDEKRVAEVVVLDQKTVDGVLVTDLLFQEISRDGKSLPYKYFQTRGEKVYVTALSIRFLEEFMARNDPQRGHALILFDRIFGDKQAPSQGSPIDGPDNLPKVFEGRTKEDAEFERALWQKFWKLVSDKAYRAEMGVDVATGKGTYLPFEPGKLYRITVDLKGNLTMDWEPLRPILLEAMKRSATQPARPQ